MNLRFWNYAGCMAMFLLVGLVGAPAAEPAPQPTAPIIPSDPKSAVVSSNSNQLDTKTSPFRNLESELKKSFQIFDTGRPDVFFRPPVGLTEPPAAGNNRRAKETMEKRAERMFPGADSGDSDADSDDPFKPAEDLLDAKEKNRKTPLDRYYDRLDRARAGVTNQVPKADQAGDHNEADGKDRSGRPFPEPLFGGELKPSASALTRRATNAAPSSGFFPELNVPKSFDELLDGRPNDLAEHSPGVKETRLDVFMQLIGGQPQSYAPGANRYSPSLPVGGATAVRPAPTSPLPTWSSTAVTANPRDAFSGRSDLVGAPSQLQSLPSFATPAPSLNLTPPTVPQSKPPMTSFSLPKRQF